jgi:uncharacterized protein (DUF1778 family)
MTEAVRYSDSITVRCQPETTELVQRAARARGTKPSEYLRQALRTALQRDGINLAISPAADPKTNPAAPESRRKACEPT